MKNDILSREQIERLVNAFYGKVKIDPLLSPVFNHVDWPRHLPIMYNFWSSMLLGDHTYRGNPLEKHLDLTIDKKHFDRWLTIFKATIDELFEGEMADEAKIRAQSIASVFQFRMGLLEKNQ